MNNSQVFYTIFGGFIFGIFVSSFITFPSQVKFVLLILGALLFVGKIFLVFWRQVILFVVIFVVTFSLGIWRLEIKNERAGGTDTILQKYLDKKVIVRGQVADEPAQKEYGFQSVVGIESLRLDPGARHFLLSSRPEYQSVEVSAKVLVSSAAFPKIKYGDKISIYGKLEKPENFAMNNGKDFDYISHLGKENIFYQMSFANVEIISGGHGSIIREKLFEFKNAFVLNLNGLISEPESSLLVGLLLGVKSSLGNLWQERFAKSGLSHIVALSGYNITIVAEGIMIALSFLPRGLALSSGAIGIILFAIITGGSATVMRASIMALFVLLAKATARTYDVVRALFLAAFFMIIHNPKILVFDLSFQLSFLSTLALIYVSPLIEPWFKFVTEKFKIREIILATVATQIFVLPFIVYKMGLVSLVALPANLLVLPVIPVIMLLGFLAGVLGFIFSWLALPLAYLTSWLLSYMLIVIKFFSELSFSSIQVKNFPLWALVLSYIVWGIIIWRSKIIFQRPTSLD